MNPFVGEACRLYVAVCPVATVAEVEPPVAVSREKSGGRLIVTVAGPLLAIPSLTEKEKASETENCAPWV